MRKLLAVIVAISALLLGGTALAEAATGTLTVFVSGEEWGPAIPYMVLAFDADIDAASLAPEDFSVVAHQNGFVMGTDVSSEADVAHTILAAYLCDEAGNAVDAETGAKILRLMDALEDNDDVQKVHSNFDLPDDVLAQME